jgi:hypothetical protein
MLRAFYVGPATDVTLRGVTIETNGPPVTLPIRFVDVLLVTNRWATEWLGHYAVLPSRGDITLERGWETVIRHEEMRCSEGVRLEVHVRCVQQIPTGGAAHP